MTHAVRHTVTNWLKQLLKGGFDPWGKVKSFTVY